MSRHHAAFLFLLTPVPPIMTAATRFHPLVSDLLELLALILRGLPVFASEIARKRRLKNCLCLTSPRPTHFCPPPTPTMTAARRLHAVVSDSNCATSLEFAPLLRGLHVLRSKSLASDDRKNCLCLTSRPTHFCPPPAPTMTAARCPHPVVSDLIVLLAMSLRGLPIS